jgi:hypothetical protein
MDGKIKLRVSIKFCVKLGKSASENLETLREAFGEHSLNRTAVFQWHSHFKAGRVSVEDERSGLPNTSKRTVDDEKIRELIHEDRCRTILELADIWISYGVCQEILTENWNMHHIVRPHVPEKHSL